MSWPTPNANRIGLDKDGKNAMHAIRYIGSRTFYQSNGVWYESDFNAGKDKAEKTILGRQPGIPRIHQVRQKARQIPGLGRCGRQSQRQVVPVREQVVPDNQKDPNSPRRRNPEERRRGFFMSH